VARDPEGRGRAYLQHWHERHTGATSLVVGAWVGADGRTPYDVLADTIAADDDLVLDLACGDGFLLEVLRSRPGRHGVSIGIDLNAAELSAARVRLGTGVPLLRGDASHLPFRTGSIGAVTCHFALMLLQPLDDVLSEVARVLSVGGVIAAVLPGSPPLGEANGWDVFRAAMAPLVTGLSVPVGAIQDERALDADALGGLLRSAALEPVDMEEREYRRRVTLDEARDSMLLTYGPDLLDGKSRAELLATITTSLEALSGDDGSVPMVDRIRLVRAVRAGR
jgi:SAM-dependent methyltransferase